MSGPQSIKAALATTSRQVLTGMLNVEGYGREGYIPGEEPQGSAFMTSVQEELL